MSGTMQTLLETPAGSLRCLLGTERPVESWHQAVAAEVAAGLGPVHAALFASPVSGTVGTVWTAPGAAVRRYADLPADDRRRLTAAAGSLLSDIRRLGESGAAPTVAAAWPALREIPSYTHLFAVDGRPVLAAWGHAGPDGRSGLLARLDDGLAFYRRPSVPWRMYARALAALALFALAAGLLLPLLAPWVMGSPAACSVPPGQLALLFEQQQQSQRADGLRSLLASLNGEQGRAQLQCPLRQAPPPRAALPQRSEMPRQDLPQDRWDRRDLSMLDGCWRKYSNMRTVDLETGQFYGVREWRLCFDQQGGGSQSIIYDDGQKCTNPLRAEFAANGQLQLKDTSRCQGGRGLMRQRSLCRRISDTEAECQMSDDEGPNANKGSSHGKFRR